MQEPRKNKFKQFVAGKTMRRFLWAIGIIVGLYVLLLVTISIYVSVSKEKLLAVVHEKINESILGKLNIGDVDVSVWKTFPKVGINLNNVVLTDSVYQRPFLKIGSVSVRIRLTGLIGKKIRVHSVKLEDAKVFRFVDKNGYTNTYVLKPKLQQQGKKKPLLIGKIELENVILVSEDVIKQKRSEIRIYDAEAGISLSGTGYHITFDEDMLIRGLGFNFPKGYWLENQRIRAKWKLELDTAKHTLSFKNTKVKIQDQPFVVTGSFYLGKPGRFHLEATTKKISYAAALAILKPTTSVKLKAINLSGLLNVKAVLDGPLAYRTTPVVKIDFATAGGDIHTPVASFTDCAFAGSFLNQVNAAEVPSDSNSKVAIDTFNSKWGSIELKTRDIVINNLKKPELQFHFSSQCTMHQLNEQLNSSAFVLDSGNARVAMAYSGPLIADPSLLNMLDATIEIENGHVLYQPRNLSFSNCNGAVSIKGNTLLMENFKCDLNTNHFVVNIKGNNINRLSLVEDGKADLQCDVYSPAIDLADFRTLFAEKTKAQKKARQEKDLHGTSGAVDHALEEGELHINLNAKRVSLHHFVAQNVMANLVFKDDYFQVKKAALQHADGSLYLTAAVQRTSPAQSRLNARLSLQRVDVRKLFYAFDNFSQSDITYKNIKGVLNTNATVAAAVSNTGKLLTGSMSGKIDFSLSNAALINMEALRNIQKFIFKNRNLDYVEFADITNTVTIKNGDLNIPRMPVQSSAITMYISGIYSLAGRTDISIQVPISSLTNKPNEDFKTIDEKKAAKPGASIYLRAKDKDGQLKIGLDVFHKSDKKKKKKKEK